MKMTKIAVMISGSGSNLQAIIDKVHNTEIYGEIALVISDKESAYGLTRAEKNKIKTVVIDRQNNLINNEYKNKLLTTFEEEDIDLIVLAGYLGFIPEEVINQYRDRIINIHPSLIPSFCGRGFYGEKVHREVLNRGVKITGATVHFVDEEMDGGPIILQSAVNVDFNDTVETIQKKVLEIEHEILPKAIELFIGERLSVENGRVNIHE